MRESLPPKAHAEPGLLSIRDLEAWYGESQALHGVNIDLRRGEIVTLLGRNGAGKTTTLRSIMGLALRRRGSVMIEGVETIGLPPNRIARTGVAYCPEDRGIFASLSVRENLALPPVIREGGMTPAEIDALFPVLAERADSPGTKLSGGEQQMLAIARILRTGCKILLLDEPTEGLAPVIVEQIATLIATIKARGYTILLVEQNFVFATGIADRHYIVQQGQVIDMIDKDEVGASMERLHGYLGV